MDQVDDIRVRGLLDQDRLEFLGVGVEVAVVDRVFRGGREVLGSEQVVAQLPDGDETVQVQAGVFLGRGHQQGERVVVGQLVEVVQLHD